MATKDKILKGLECIKYLVSMAIDVDAMNDFTQRIMDEFKIDYEREIALDILQDLVK